MGLDLLELRSVRKMDFGGLHNVKSIYKSSVATGIAGLSVPSFALTVITLLRGMTSGTIIACTGFKKFVEKDVVLQTDQSELVTTVLGEASQTVSVATDALQMEATTGTRQGRSKTRPLCGGVKVGHRLA
jgi:hypothetical protein